ncbi:hypothetical protein BJF79_22575 [Actinomadura sp. CNU-125]|nr:hypothetical protein BJF79_22575 [Actinomadura sp. CNU-125]
MRALGDRPGGRRRLGEDSAHGAASAVGAGIRTFHVHADESAPGTVPVRDLDAIADLLGENR